MAMATEVSCVAQIGEVAGVIWHRLDTKGSATQSKLIKELKLPRDLVMQGLGWLAREDKINIEETARSRVISLR